jgi:CubicO group peptidase (beta-lactamase class C family)
MRRPVRVLRTLASSVGALLVLGAAAIQLSGHGCFWRALAATDLQGHTTAHIDDASNFAQRTIAAGTPRPWPVDPRLNRDPLDADTLAHLTRHGTAALLVAQDGALLHESYYAPYDADSRTHSFSVAKTITTILLGLAVRQGMVTGFDAPLVERLPEYADDPRGRRATVSQLSAMKAGHDWDEHYTCRST